MRLMEMKYTSVFNSESNDMVRRMHLFLHPGCKIEKDVMHPQQRPCNVDLYVAGPPCQSFSSMGAKRGLEDMRGQVLHGVLQFIVRHRPKVVILENVSGLVAKFKVVVVDILRALIKADYEVTWDRINTRDHGVAQCRIRLYIVAIQKRYCLQTFRFPKKLKIQPPVDAFLDRGRPNKLNTATAQRNIAVVHRALKDKGVQPQNTTVLIDVQASANFQNYQVDCSPCLTASRCKTGGFYISTQKRMLDVVEMSRLQGFPSWITTRLFQEFVEIGGKRAATRHVGHAIGNAMSLNVICRLMTRALLAAGRIQENKDAWKYLSGKDCSKRLPDALFAHTEEGFFRSRKARPNPDGRQP